MKERVIGNARTDDEINLRSKFKSEVFVAHERVHLYRLDYPMFRNSLVGIRWYISVWEETYTMGLALGGEICEDLLTVLVLKPVLCFSAIIVVVRVFSSFAFGCCFAFTLCVWLTFRLSLEELLDLVVTVCCSGPLWRARIVRLWMWEWGPFNHCSSVESP